MRSLLGFTSKRARRRRTSVPGAGISRSPLAAEWGRETYFAGLKRSLKPGGRVAIIERMKKGFGFNALFGHHTSPEIIRGRMEKAGYILSESFGFLRKQTFSLFMKRT